MKRTRNGFTLVELLVVITIIGILASLITAAAVNARRTAKNAAVLMEVKQLEMACQAYKEKLGDYPPDFARSDTYSRAADGTTAYWQRAVLRHLAKAFPRYRPGITSTPTPFAQPIWLGLLDDINNGWQLNVTATDANALSPASAMTFWLGGKPEWNGPAGNPTDVTKPITAFRGFSANVANPFDNSPSRIQPFFEFNLMCLRYSTTDGLAVWPVSACDQGTSPLVYIRANNSTYFQEGSTTTMKFYRRIRPAMDMRLSNPTAPVRLTWVNPTSFQIFSSGQDMTYGELQPTTITGFANTNNVLQFPTGTNYAPETFDDITNFSGGTLEDAIPQ